MQRAKRTLLTAMLGAALLPAAAQGQSPPDPADATPLMLDQPLEGTLDTVGERDVLSLRATVEFSLVQVAVTHTNAQCEVWATLVDIDGTTLGRAYVVGRQATTVTALAAAAGPIFVMIDSGPYAACAGAQYRVLPTVTPFATSTFAPASGPNPTGMAAAGSDPVRCYAWSKRVEQLSVKLRRTRESYRRAQGSRRRRLERKLAQLTRLYRAAKAKAAGAC